jgi:hypothetical protein
VALTPPAQSPVTQVLPFSPQSAVQAQPSAPQVQVDGWQVVGSGSGVHVWPDGQPVVVQLTGFGLPAQVVSSGTQVLPFIPQSSVHTQPSAAQLQCEGWQVVGSASGKQISPEAQLVWVQLTGFGSPAQVSPPVSPPPPPVPPPRDEVPQPASARIEVESKVTKVLKRFMSLPFCGLNPRHPRP